MGRSAARWGVALVLLALSCNAAFALDTVRLGKAVPNSFAFGAADVGVQAKIYQQEGIDLSITAFEGDAKLQQALTANGVDVGVGSGPGMGFRVKGAADIAVAAMFGPPSNLALLVLPQSPIKSASDLKGKRIGVTTVGSLTEWLVRELSRQEGWGSDGIKIAALGGVPARLAAMQRGELDGTVQESATGYELEDQGKARILLLFGDIAKHFYTHVIFASDDMVNNRPDLLRRFLRGWFKTIAFMKANKDFTIQSESKTIQVRPEVAEKIYDAQMSSFSTDGSWDPQSIDVIRHSLKDLGILATVPEASELYTDKFVPVKF